MIFIIFCGFETDEIDGLMAIIVAELRLGFGTYSAVPFPNLSLYDRYGQYTGELGKGIVIPGFEGLLDDPAEAVKRISLACGKNVPVSITAAPVVAAMNGEELK